MDPALSAIRGTNVEGPALNPEPSTISTSSVEGSTHGSRTVHDSGPKRGRSSPGHRTVHDIDLHRGRFASETQLSMIQALSMEGPAMDIEPSAISTSSVDGSALGCQTFRDSGPNCGRFAPGY